jgi:hypothetical protein
LHPITPPPRGIYVCHWLDAAGDVLLVAVTGDGRRIAELPCKPATRDEAHATLKHLLDALDPIAVLRVI